MTSLDLPALEALHAKATPGPWTEDDGNLFSKPLSDFRHEQCMRIVQGEAIPHPDEGLDEPLGFVAKCFQTSPNFEADAEFLAALVTAAPELLRLARIGQEAERLQKGFV